MCGILGEISLNGDLLNNKALFEEALVLQRHRGPDDSDIYENNKFIFGHRRLSIIDLAEHSKQPMVSSCGNFIIVFNGEIYNYRDLREGLIEKGYIFKTEGDTEVLLYSFIEYGIECVQSFIGMFAFAIFDKSRNESYIVRDRLGIKPLYFSRQNKKLIFSSEVKSILHLEKRKRILNKAAISSYLSFRYPILNDTFFEGIYSLPPAHYMKVTSSSLETVEYWNVAKKFKEQSNDRGEKYYLGELKNILESAVKYRMISDVPIGAFLSGGVDSSIITAIMSENSQLPIKTFSIGFPDEGFNEFKYANLISNKFNTEHTNILLEGHSYIEEMEALIKLKDAPLSVPNEVPLYLMSKKLKESITVVLSGEGADEIFGGYGRIFRSAYDYERIKNIDNLNLSEKEKRNLVSNFINKYLKESFDSEISHFKNIYSYMSVSDKERLLNEDFDIAGLEKRYTSYFMNFFDELKEESYYNKLMYTFEKIHLLGLLQRVDSSTMATSVEARVPFVDHRLVEFSFTIPVKYKLKWKDENSQEASKVLMSDKISEEYDIPKYILKKAYSDVIPHEVLHRRKVGFPVPLNSWFGSSFNAYAKKILLSDDAKNRGIYNIHNITKVLNDTDRLNSDHGFAMIVWMLINLELFCCNYFKGDN